MALSSGTAEVGEEAVQICGIPENGVRVRNLGGSAVWFGGPDVTAEPGGPGFPLEPGESEMIPGSKARESPVVPAPEGDMALPQLYGRTADGAGISQVAWIAAG